MNKRRRLQLFTLCLAALIGLMMATSGHAQEEGLGYMPVTSLAYSPDGSTIAVAGQPLNCQPGEANTDPSTHAIRILDATTRAVISTLNVQTCYAGWVSWSPDGTRITSSSYEGPVSVWDVMTGAQVSMYAGSANQTLRFDIIRWSPVDDRIVMQTKDGEANTIIWDAGTGNVIGPVLSREAPAGGRSVRNGVAWSPDGTQIAITTSDNKVKIFDVTPANAALEQWPLLLSIDLDRHAYTLDWSPDGRQIAVALGGVIHIFDASTGQLVQTLTDSQNSLLVVDWSPTGSRIAASSDDGLIRIWDVASSMEVAVFAQEIPVTVLDWHPNRQAIAFNVPSNLSGQLVDIADTPDVGPVSVQTADNAAGDSPSDGQNAAILRHNLSIPATLTHASWNPAGTLLAVSGYDGIRVFDSDLEPVGSVFGGEGHWFAVEWSPDGQQLAASNSSIGTTFIWYWDAQAGVAQPLRTLPNLDAFEGVTGAYWSPDGSKMVTIGTYTTSASYYGVYQEWNTATGERLSVLPYQMGFRTPRVAWSPDGSRIAGGGIQHCPPTVPEGQCLPGGPVVFVASVTDPDDIWFARVPLDPSDLDWSQTTIAVATGGYVETFDPLTGVQLLSIDTSQSYRLRWSPDGQYLAAMSGRGAVDVLAIDGATYEVIGSFQSHVGDLPNSLEWGSNNLITITNGNGLLEVWDVSRLVEVTPTAPNASSTSGAAGEPLATVGSSPIGQNAASLRSSLTLTTTLTRASWNPDGTLLAVSGYDGIRVVDGDLRPVGSVFGSGGHWLSVEWSPDGRRLAATDDLTRTTSIWAWDTRTGVAQPLRTLPNLDNFEGASGAYWSPDGSRLLTIGDYSTPAAVYGVFQVWDAASGERLNVLPHDVGFYAPNVAWSPDGSMIAASGIAHCPRKLPNGQCLPGGASTFITRVMDSDELVYVPYGGIAADLDWSQTTLALADAGHIRTYDPITRLIVIDFASAESYRLRWAPDGRYLATIGENGVVDILTINGATYQLIGSFQTHIGHLPTSFEWGRSNLISITTGSGELQVWDVSGLAEATTTPAPTPQ